MAEKLDPVPDGVDYQDHSKWLPSRLLSLDEMPLDSEKQKWRDWFNSLSPEMKLNVIGTSYYLRPRDGE